MGSSISEAEEIGLAKLPRSYTLYLYTLHYSRLGKKLTSIAPLAPVYHIIIDHLALVAPTKAVVLSKYVYDFITPSLYRNVIASKTLLRGLESSDPGLQRKLKCLEHVETLRVQDMAGMWHVSMLNHEAAEQQRKNVFPNCRRVELCRDVVNGHYHSKTGENVEDWEFFEIKEMLMEQVKEGCDMVEVRRLRAERQEDDTKSMTFSLAVDSSSDDKTIESEFWLPACGKAVGISIIIGVLAILWAPFILLTIVSCAGYYIPSLSITTATANITSADGSSWAIAKISLGPSGGCMYYGDLPRKCVQTLSFKPNTTFLNLPANETLTTSLSQTLNRAFVTNHLTAIWAGIAALSFIVDIILEESEWPILSTWTTTATIIFAWLSFWLNVAICLNFRHHLNQNDHASGWEYHPGNGLWMFLYSVLHLSAWSALLIYAD